MKITDDNILAYLPISENDEKWGISCTTVGFQKVNPNSRYPVRHHPSDYNFTKRVGRILNEYQLVFIIEGEGEFESKSCPKTKVSAGTMILLFPGEWHSYAPSKESGWSEWWVGFKGINIDNRVKAGFFSPSEPLIYIGRSVGIENLYQEIYNEAINERPNFQILISGIVLHILGSILYKNSTINYNNDPLHEKINEAKTIMRNTLAEDISVADIASQLNVGYSLFRHSFKEHVGISPTQYIQMLKHNRAKELLSSSNIPIAEISYQLNFQNSCQFSTFFKRREGMSAREYRMKHNYKLVSVQQ